MVQHKPRPTSPATNSRPNNWSESSTVPKVGKDVLRNNGLGSRLGSRGPRATGPPTLCWILNTLRCKKPVFGADGRGCGQKLWHSDRHQNGTAQPALERLVDVGARQLFLPSAEQSTDVLSLLLFPKPANSCLTPVKLPCTYRSTRLQPKQAFDSTR